VFVDASFQVVHAGVGQEPLDMIGRPASDVERTNPPLKKISDLWEWWATFRDNAHGYPFPVAIRAQIHEGRILAVGIWSNEYRFWPEKDKRGRWGFQGEEKPDHNRRKMYWVFKGGEAFSTDYCVFPVVDELKTPEPV